MPKSYQQVIDELQSIRPLPYGYTMECWDSDNIIVKGPSCGFAILRSSIEDNLHQTQYLGTIERLIEIESMGGAAYLDALPAKLENILNEDSLVGDLMNKFGK